MLAIDTEVLLPRSLNDGTGSDASDGRVVVDTSDFDVVGLMLAL